MKEQRNLVLPKLNLIVLEISARYEKQFNDKDKTDSDNCSSIPSRVSRGSPAPGIEWEFNMTKQLLLKFL
jgi:hypothetical protein